MQDFCRQSITALDAVSLLEVRTSQEADGFHCLFRLLKLFVVAVIWWLGICVTLFHLALSDGAREGRGHILFQLSSEP